MRTGWWDFLDPFSWLGDQVADAVTGIWTMMMMALWNSGLWVLRLEFAVIDALTTPDLSEDGPARRIRPRCGSLVPSWSSCWSSNSVSQRSAAAVNPWPGP